MAELEPSRASSQTSQPAPTTSSSFSDASEASAKASSSRHAKPGRIAASPSKRAVTRASRSKYDIKLHSPIKSVKPKPEAQPDLSSLWSQAQDVTESRASGSNIFSSSAPFSPPRRGSSSVFGPQNALFRGSGLGFSPERSPVRRPDWSRPDSDSLSNKRSSVVYEDSHDLSFEIASPQRRKASSIFARSPESSLGGASTSARLVDPVPVGVSTKRRRDTFDASDEDVAREQSSSKSPVRKRVAFTQPGSVSPKENVFNTYPPSLESLVTSPTKSQRPTSYAPEPLRAPTSPYSDISSSPSSSEPDHPALTRSQSLPTNVGLAAPLPIRSSESSSVPNALDPIPESPTKLIEEDEHHLSPISPFGRSAPPRRSRSLTDFTFEALAEDAQGQNQLRRSSSRVSRSPSSASPTSRTSRSITLDDFLSDSFELRAPRTPQLVFGGALPPLEDSAISAPVDVEERPRLSQPPKDIPMPSAPLSMRAEPLTTLMEEDAEEPTEVESVGNTSSSGRVSAESSFSTEGMSEAQIAKLTRIQSMVSRLKPCRRLSTPLPPPAPHSSALPTSRLRSGNNLDAHVVLEARPRPALVRRGSLLEQASLSSASQVLERQRSPPVSPDASRRGILEDITDQFPLADVVAFVDVRTAEGDDASSVFVEMLKSLGARVLSRHTSIVTHIVFKGGRNATLERVKACRQRPHVVGIGWIVKSKETMTRAPEHEYKVDLGRSAFLQKNRRKSFEPRAFTAGKLGSGQMPAAPRLGALGEKSSNVFRGNNASTLEQAKKAGSMFKPKVGSPLAKRLSTPEITE